MFLECSINLGEILYKALLGTQPDCSFHCLYWAIDISDMNDFSWDADYQLPLTVLLGFVRPDDKAKILMWGRRGMTWGRTLEPANSARSEKGYECT